MIVVIVIVLALGFIFLREMGKGRAVGTGGAILALILIAFLISMGFSVDFSSVVLVMLLIFAIIIVFAVINARSKSKEQAQDDNISAAQSKEGIIQRKEFYDYKRKWGEDLFSLFGWDGSSSGRDLPWQEAEKKLALLEESYYPYPMGMRLPIADADLRKHKLEKSQYKIKDIGSSYAELYLALSDVEDYIVYRNSTGNYYKPSLYEEIPKEVRNLFYEGKITIGVPYGHGLGQPVPCQVMTFQEAREFMQARMEEQFREHQKVS